VRSFVVIGQTATASAEFRLDDLPGSSGRLDVLLRCVRAALLVSHGLRPDVRVYLVLRGGAPAPRVVRIDSNTARFIRPDERSLALLVQKTLAAAPADLKDAFVELRPGVALAAGDLACALADVSNAELYVLEEGAPEFRAAGSTSNDVMFVLGDHLGFAAADRADLAARGASAVSIGPLSLHSDDVITIVSNELSRARPS
jgi:tRNA (pseudouridine54-N1)-methyltransferase